MGGNGNGKTDRPRTYESIRTGQNLRQEVRARTLKLWVDKSRSVKKKMRIKYQTNKTKPGKSESSDIDLRIDNSNAAAGGTIPFQLSGFVN
jgi:hypothetical protein